MTEELFREDAYLSRCQATVTAVDARGIGLDRTVFYYTGGGQPGDSGVLQCADGREIAIIDCIKDPGTGAQWHLPADSVPRPPVAERIVAEIDWTRRHRHMRMHTCLHLLSALVAGKITGAALTDSKARIDLDLPDPLDKDRLQAALDRVIAEDRAVRALWISDEELAARPDLVRTMTVQPPAGRGRVRLIEVEGVDLQPCGGTHVRSTGEIGAVLIGKIDKKGRHNRRINVRFVD
ncbi:MAG: alanyl-tRNA editing protein [Rhodospirillales bacterium]